MKNKPLAFIAVAVLAVVVIVIVVTRLGSQNGGISENVRTGTGGSRIDFQATNLDPLAKGHYEGWAIVGNRKVSFGKFNVNEQKQLVDLSGKLIKEFRTTEKVDNIDAFAISIEEDNDTDAGPSDSLMLFGKAENNRADLSFGAGPGQIDFTVLSGSYILGTPTDDPDKNETAGVWFLDPTDAPDLTASLNLPDAPTGWKYEGWAVHAVIHPISTGRFTSITGSDEFDGYSSTKKPSPPFPGEDFIRNLPFGLKGPLELGDGSSVVVVSIEPDVAGVDPTGDGPFQLKPLIGKIPAGAKDHFLYKLELKKESLPTGIASLVL